MAYLEWSTDVVSERERFSFWRDGFLAPLGIAAEPDPAAHGPFRAKIVQYSRGALRHIKVEAAPHLVMRGPREIARRGRQGYSIYRETGEGCWFRCAGRELVTNRGDLVITDADMPWESRSVAKHRLETLLIPKIALEPHLPLLERPLVMQLSGRAGAGALTPNYFASLMRELNDLDLPTIEAMTDTFCRLIAIACGVAAAAQPSAVRAARLAQAKHYSDQHLADPELSPMRVAAALGISVRALHLLFEPTGDSFARYVMRRRLEECRATLANRVAHRRTIADIAFAWGFNSLATFYRAFNREFGTAPGEVRASARPRADLR